MLKLVGKIKKFLNNKETNEKDLTTPSSNEQKNLVKDKKEISPALESIIKNEINEEENDDDDDKYNLFSEEEEEELPSSEDEDEVSLFPKPMYIDNSLSVNSTAIPCSYKDTLHQPGMLSPSFTSNMNGSHHSLINSMLSPSNSSTRFSNPHHGLTSPLSFNQNNNNHNNKQNLIPTSYSPNNQLMNNHSAVGTPAMIPPRNDTSLSNLMHHNNHSNNNSPMSSVGIQNNNHGNNSVSVGISPSGSAGTEELPSDFNLPPNVNFICHYCDASFQVRGYLSRHIKKHAIVKEYTCPYYRYSADVKNYISHELQNREYHSEEEKIDAIKKAQSIKHECHSNNGEFWRKDTLMVHLKKKHFKINKDVAKAAVEHGGKKIDTSKLPGYCVSCNEQFNNADEFCQTHVLKNGCPALPNGYSIKTDLGDDKSRNNKCVLKLIKFSNNDARFIFTKSAVVDPEVFSNREVIDLIVDMAEKNNNNNGLQPTVTPDNRRISPVTSGENSTPIVEKLYDNRIVIHPDAVVPIDINKKRKKRRSKKEMMLARGEITKEQLENLSTSNGNSPGLQPFVSNSSSSLSSNEINGYKISAGTKVYQPLPQSQPPSTTTSLQSPDSQLQVLDVQQRKQQQQILFQLYQQQQQMLQQQMLQQKQQQLLQQHISNNNNNSNVNNGDNSNGYSVRNGINSNMPSGDCEKEDFKALDDEYEYSNTDTNTNNNMGFSGKSSPGSSSTYNANNMVNAAANGEKGAMYNNNNNNNGYTNGNGSYYGQQMTADGQRVAEEEEVDENELAMDDGF